MEDGKEYFEEKWEMGESVQLGIVTAAGQWTVESQDLREFFQGLCVYVCVLGGRVVVVVYNILEKASCAAGLFLS